jgi:hypothetical protein
MAFARARNVESYCIVQGPVVQTLVSLTLGIIKIRSKFFNSLFMNIETFLYKSRLGQKEFSSLEFQSKQTYRKTQTKTLGYILTQVSVNLALNNRPQVVSRINRAMYDFFVDC